MSDITFEIDPDQGDDITFDISSTSQGPPGEGVPAGGDAGKVLAKVTSADYDTAWITATGAGGRSGSVAVAVEANGANAWLLDVTGADTGQTTFLCGDLTAAGAVAGDTVTVTTAANVSQPYVVVLLADDLAEFTWDFDEAVGGEEPKGDAFYVGIVPAEEAIGGPFPINLTAQLHPSDINLPTGSRIPISDATDDSWSSVDLSDDPTMPAGSSSIPTTGAVRGFTHASTDKTTPVDADEFLIADSAHVEEPYSPKKLTFANLRAWLNTLFVRLTWAPLTVRKSSGDTTHTSNAVLVNDADLKFAIGASETWTFRAVLYAYGPTGADLSVGLNLPSGATVRSLVWGPANSYTGAAGALQIQGTITASTAAGAAGFGTWGTGTTTAAAASIVIEGTVINSTTPGDVTIQHCQAVSTGTATTVEAFSTLTARRLS